MLRRYFLINIALISAAGFLGYEVYEFQSKPMNIPAKIEKKQSTAETEEKAENNPVEKKTDVSSFHVIVQKDLFRPSRTEPKPDELKSGVPAAPPPRLIGTVITEDGAKAYLEDFVTKTTRAFKLKESIAGFTVHEIKENSVILIKGGEKTEVTITKIETVKNPTGTALPSQGPYNTSPVQSAQSQPAKPLPVAPSPLPTPSAAPQPIIKSVK